MDGTISDLLSNMVVDAGGHVGDICIRTNASGSRSVVATAPIAEGDKLLAVPRALILASSSYEELRVKLLLEQAGRSGNEQLLAAVDYQKMYDGLPRWAVVAVFERLGVPPPVLRAFGEAR